MCGIAEARVRRPGCRDSATTDPQVGARPFDIAPPRDDSDRATVLNSRAAARSWTASIVPSRQGARGRRLVGRPGTMSLATALSGKGARP
jgi:hypothetical protein